MITQEQFYSLDETGIGVRISKEERERADALTHDFIQKMLREMSPARREYADALGDYFRAKDRLIQAQRAMAV